MERNISTFIEQVIKQKKFHFEKDDTAFDPALIENNILKMDNNTITVADFQSIVPDFIKVYSDKFNFQISQDFEKSVNFIASIKEDFLSNGHVGDFYILEKEIWRYITFESNSQFHATFKPFMESIHSGNNTDSVFEFMDAYSELLPKLNLPIASIFENAVKQLQFTKKDVDYNHPMEKVLRGIVNKCKSDYDLGLELLAKSLSVDEETESLLSAVVVGLYEKKRIEFFETTLKNLIEKEIRLYPIFLGLSSVSEVEETDCDLFVKLIKKHANDDALIISLLSLVFTILKSTCSKYHDFCFEVLKSAIRKEKTAYFILGNLNRINDYPNERTSIILELIDQEYFSIEKFIKTIGHVFWYLKDFDSFKKVTLCIIQNRPNEKFAKNFQHFFTTVEETKLDEFIITLLTDNRASHRLIGVEIFDVLSHPVPYKFSFDILSLPPISQYKLWVALTHDFHEPKNRLVALLPLLDSKSEYIQESFLSKLEDISEDYGGHVTLILEEHFNTNIPKYSSALQRIKSYVEEFHETYATPKFSITEFNPYHVHFKHIKYFDELFSKKMGESVEKGSKENSLLSLLGTNTVQLAKGGGWRFGNKKEISQLGRVGASFVMPRSYFINPDQFELEKGALLYRDWTDEQFSEVKSFIDSEQQ